MPKLHAIWEYLFVEPNYVNNDKMWLECPLGQPPVLHGSTLPPGYPGADSSFLTRSRSQVDYDFFAKRVEAEITRPDQSRREHYQQHTRTAERSLLIAINVL